MASKAVQEIERAIATLTPHELEELYVWFDQHPHPLDVRIQSDLAAGRLDNVIERALSDEKTIVLGRFSSGWDSAPVQIFGGDMPALPKENPRPMSEFAAQRAGDLVSPNHPENRIIKAEP